MSNTKINDKIFNTINILLLTLFTFVCFYPFYLLFINSLSSPENVMNGVFIIPKGFTFFNYKIIFSNDAVSKALVISVLRTVLGTVITILCSSFFAFLFTKKKLPFRKFMYRMTIFTMYINSGVIPYYIVMKNYRLNNNFLLYIIPGAVGAFFIILFKTYFESLPAAFEESAAIDGAGIITVFLKIILPVSMPIIASVAVFSAVGQWNSWFDNFLLNTSSNLKTLQLLLYETLNKTTIQLGDLAAGGAGGAGIAASKASQPNPMSVRITMTMVTVIPILIVYPSLQRYFVKGLMLGAIKG